MGQINLTHVDYAVNYPNNWFALFFACCRLHYIGTNVRLAWRLGLFVEGKSFPIL